MKILVVSDPPMITHSCAVVCSQLSKQWVKLGHEVIYLGYNYTGEAYNHSDGYTVYPDLEPPTRYKSVKYYIDKFKVDLVYAHGSKNVFAEGMKAAREAGIPYVPHTFYSTPTKNDKVTTFEAKNGFILYDCNEVDDMFVCNNFSVGVGYALGKRTWYVPNGVDTNIFYPRDIEAVSYRETMGISKGDIVFLFSGSNISGKDPGRALDAFAKFYHRRSKEELELQPTYLVMHTRPTNSHLDLKQIAKDLGVDHVVKFFTDYLPEWLEQPEADKNYHKGSFSPPYTTTPYDLMGNVFRTGDVLLAPTLMEGQSTTILEGMACGLPVICGDDPVVSEPVTNFSTGLLVHRHLTNENKTDEIVQHMEYFYSNFCERVSMGTNAAKYIRIKHNWKVIAYQFIYYFKTLLDKKYD